MKRIAFLLVIAATASFASATEPTKEQLANWHQWRGPLGSGASPDGDPPVTWDEKTNVRWKAPLPGRGSSTPIIWGDRVFLLTAIDTRRAADPRDIPKLDPRIVERNLPSNQADPRFDRLTKAPRTYYQSVVLCLDRQGRRRARPARGTSHHPLLRRRLTLHRRPLPLCLLRLARRVLL
jgi:hypothetical protein